MFGAIIFVLFGSGEEQEWAKAPNEENHVATEAEPTTPTTRDFYTNTAFVTDTETLTNSSFGQKGGSLLMTRF